MFRAPTRVRIGPGVLSAIGEALPGQRLVLVTDPGLEETPWPARVRDAIAAAGATWVQVDQVEPNPRTSTVDDAVRRLSGAGIDGVIAVGGGSVIDAAKGIAAGLTNPGPVAALEGRNRFGAAPLPLLAIPTTCGTGSEVTWVSVLTLAEERRKISVKGEALFPAAAFVDPNTLITLPPHLIASTGMDAMTHAVEAYVSRVGNPVSEALAESAVRSLLQNLAAVVDQPAANALERERVMTASTVAGLAFGNADVGAVHCLSEAIGGRHDLPHGLLNAVLLVPVLRHHGQAAIPGLNRLASRVGLRDGNELLDALALLSMDVGLPGFGELNVPVEDYGAIAGAAEANGSNGSNPRTWTAGDYRDVLNQLTAA